MTKVAETTSGRPPIGAGPRRPRWRSILRSIAAATPFLAVHLGCALVVLYPPTWPLVLLATASYLLRMWAITAGYHRYFAHRSYKTSRAFQLVLAVLGATAMQQGPLWWASWHRVHHKHTDEAGDPHSPILDGVWHAHVGWVFDGRHASADLGKVSDLTAYPELVWIDRHDKLVLAGYALLCFAIAGLPGVVWGFLISSVAVTHATFCINSLAHLWGSRRYATDDWSRNNAPLALLTLGEGWHNNHHHYMASARQGFFWWEIDVSYYVLKVLSWLGIVWDLRAPPEHLLEGDRDASLPTRAGDRAHA